MNILKEKCHIHGFFVILKLMLFVGMSTSVYCENIPAPVEFARNDHSILPSEKKTVDRGSNPDNTKEKNLKNKEDLKKFASKIFAICVCGISFRMALRKLEDSLSQSLTGITPNQFNFYQPDGEGFSDIGGNQQVLSSLREMVNAFRQSDRVLQLGGRPSRGLMLYGPPGTGKTVIVKALAREMGIPFMIIKGSDLIQPLIGQSSKNVRALFECARKREGKTVIFIDEADSLLKDRRLLGQSSPETEGLITEFLQQMDGIQSDNKVMIILATNYPNMIDQAIQRAGRIDQKFEIPLPDDEGKMSIFKVLTRKRFKVDQLVVANEDSLREPLRELSTGAEIENWLNTAAIKAALAGKNSITLDDLKASVRVRR